MPGAPLPGNGGGKQDRIRSGRQQFQKRSARGFRQVFRDLQTDGEVESAGQRFGLGKIDQREAFARNLQRIEGDPVAIKAHHVGNPGPPERRRPAADTASHVHHRPGPQDLPENRHGPVCGPGRGHADVVEETLIVAVHGLGEISEIGAGVEGRGGFGSGRRNRTGSVGSRGGQEMPG